MNKANGTYSDYRKHKLKKAKAISKSKHRDGNGRDRKWQHLRTRPRALRQTLLSRQYLCNKFNCLRVVVLMITILLILICTLYASGSLLTLKLQDFWCDEYSWDEIVAANSAVNSSIGIGGCYTSTRVTVNDAVLYETDVNHNALTVVEKITPMSIIKCIMFSGITVGLVYLLVYHCWRCLLDCKKTIDDEWYVCVFSTCIYKTFRNR